VQELFAAIFNQFASPAVDEVGDPAIDELGDEAAGIPNALSTLLTGGLHNTFVPQYPSYPYCVFQLISGTADHLFIETLEDVLLQFSIFDNSESAATVCSVYNALNALYDNCALSIANYGFISMLREFQHLLRLDEAEGGFWQFVVQYRIRLVR
jgi:hypothetical protein